MFSTMESSSGSSWGSTGGCVCLSSAQELNSQRRRPASTPRLTAFASRLHQVSTRAQAAHAVTTTLTSCLSPHDTVRLRALDMGSLTVKVIQVSCQTNPN